MWATTPFCPHVLLSLPAVHSFHSLLSVKHYCDFIAKGSAHHEAGTMNSQQSGPARSNISPASQTFRQRWGILVIACLTTGVLSFTFFFACNISAETPVASDLIFDQPQRSVLALNILSQISMFLLYELTTSLLESIRWTLACSRSGTSAFTFLILSRATNNIGILSLVMSKGSTPRKIQKDGHRLWGTQRYVSKSRPI